MVGIVVTISPNFNLYRIVVLPAASRPTIKILISFLPKRPLNKVANIFPMAVVSYVRIWNQRVQLFTNLSKKVSPTCHWTDIAHEQCETRITNKERPTPTEQMAENEKIITKQCLNNATIKQTKKQLNEKRTCVDEKQVEWRNRRRWKNET